MLLGTHLSISKGLNNTVDKAVQIGANCLQIFASAPKNWQESKFTDAEIKNFKDKLLKNNITPLFIHAVYLINLASSNPEIYQKSINSLIADMRSANKLNAKGVILHLGSHLGVGLDKVFPRLILAIKKILQKSPPKPYFIIENSAGSKGKIGSRLEDLVKIIKKVKDPRIKICLDTAHALASGYKINSRKELDQFLKKFDNTLGLDKLVCIHTNDSKVPLGSGVDRHENIGQGFIGLNGFKLLLNHPKLRHLPFIIETPGFQEKGADKKNLQILKSLIHQGDTLSA